MVLQMLKTNQNTSLHNIKEEDDDLTILITIDCSEKTVSITIDTEVYVEEHDITFYVLGNHNALIASLYSQVNLLKNEIEEKTILIRALIIKDHEVYDDNNSNLNKSTSEYITTSEHDTNSNYDGDTFLEDPTKATNLP